MNTLASAQEKNNKAAQGRPSFVEKANLWGRTRRGLRFFNQKNVQVPQRANPIVRINLLGGQSHPNVGSVLLYIPCAPQPHSYNLSSLSQKPTNPPTV